MQSVRQFDRVWIAILPKQEAGDGPRVAGGQAPVALVPGWVTNADVRTRPVPRRGGERMIQNSVVVVSFHRLPDGREFYRRQAQGLLGLYPRDVYVPAIDGPVDERPSTEWIAELGDRIAASADNLVTGPSEDLLAAAAAEYGATQELVTA